MSATARAEARRKAILSRGSDRLARLTTSARGDEPVYMHDDPPLPHVSTGLKNFVGEETTMPSPPNRLSPSPSPRIMPAAVPTDSSPTSSSARSNNRSDSSVWSEQQQQQFLQALMAASPSSRSSDSLPGLATTDVDPSLPHVDNPFTAMLFPSAKHALPSEASGKALADTVTAPPTRLQKFMPIIHLLIMWCMLAFFVLYREPQVYAEMGGDIGDTRTWRRWAELGLSSPMRDVTKILRIQVVPFFWAFTTLQIVLHSVRIFSGFDAVQPPTLLAIALPHLPPPLPSMITNGLKYLQMGSLFLDDLSGLVVGLGFIVYFSGYLAS